MSMLKTSLAAVAALSLGAAPALAADASMLSLGNARIAAATSDESDLFGGSELIGILIFAAAVGAVITVAGDGDSDEDALSA